MKQPQTFDEYLNTTNSDAIKLNLREHFGAEKNLFAANVAYIVYMLIGGKLEEINGRLDVVADIFRSKL